MDASVAHLSSDHPPRVVGIRFAGGPKKAEAPRPELVDERAVAEDVIGSGRPRRRRIGSRRRLFEAARELVAVCRRARDVFDSAHVRAVPVEVEERAHPREQSAHDHDVKIQVVLVVGLPEVFVADVAAAGDGNRTIGNEQLVVHAAVEASEVEERPGEAGSQSISSRRKWIEQPQFEVGRRRQAEQQRVLAGGGEVVDEQAHSHAAQCGVAQRAKKKAAGRVVVDLVVLNVEATLSAACQVDPRGQRVVATGHEAKAGEIAIGLSGKRHPTQLGLVRHRDGRRRRQRTSVGKTGATADDRSDGQPRDAREAAKRAIHSISMARRRCV